MMALAPADRSKLAKMLAMLGSNHAGERDAAALAASRLVRARGLNWQDVLAGSEGGAICAPLSGEMSRRRDVYQPSPVPDHVGDLQTCGRRLDLLTRWEVAFVTGLAQQSAPVTRRQREILAGVAAKVRTAGPRAG